jgi:hypothetical protein
MRIATRQISKNGKTAMLVEMLVQLPRKEQLEIYRLLGQWLKKKPGKVSVVTVPRAPKNEFLKTEFGQYLLEEADAQIPIEKVRKALSTITGSLAQEIIAEREER